MYQHIRQTRPFLMSRVNTSLAPSIYTPLLSYTPFGAQNIIACTNQWSPRFIQRWFNSNTSPSKFNNKNSSPTPNISHVTSPPNTNYVTNEGTFCNQELSTDTAKTSEHASSELIEELRKALDAAEEQINIKEEKIKELHDRLLRSLADNENSRQRHEKELSNVRQYGISKFAESLLSVADNLELALQHTDETNVATASVIEGITMTNKIFMNIMEDYGIQPFESLYQPFSPTLHEALFEMPHPDYPKGTVVQVIKKGYKIKDRVLRPAKVGTAK